MLHGGSSETTAACRFGPDCPYCLNGVPRPAPGVRGKCDVTRKMVYDPPDDDAAEFYAGLAFVPLMYGIPFIRRYIMGEKDAPVLEPEDGDVKIAARGAKKFIMRRAPQMAQYDDIALLLHGLGGYAMAAATAKPKLPGVP